MKKQWIAYALCIPKEYKKIEEDGFSHEEYDYLSVFLKMKDALEEKKLMEGDYTDKFKIIKVKVTEI